MGDFGGLMRGNCVVNWSCSLNALVGPMVKLCNTGQQKSPGDKTHSTKYPIKSTLERHIMKKGLKKGPFCYYFMVLKGLLFPTIARPSPDALDRP